MSSSTGATGSPATEGVESLLEPRLALYGTAQLDEAISVVAWAPDGAGLAAGTLGGEVALCGMDGRVTIRLDTAAPVLDLSWSPTGNVVAAACEDGAVWLWPAGGEPRRHAVGAAAERLAWGAAGLAVAAGDAVLVLDETGGDRLDLAVPPGAALVVAWTGPGAGATLLAGGVGGLRQVLVAGSGGEAWPRAAVVALAVDPTSGVVAAGTLGGDVEMGRGARRCRSGATPSRLWPGRRPVRIWLRSRTGAWLYGRFTPSAAPCPAPVAWRATATGSLAPPFLRLVHCWPRSAPTDAWRCGTRPRPATPSSVSNSAVLSA